MTTGSLSDYLAKYGTLLGQSASAATKPLHTPGVDALIEPALLLEPYPAQAHCITAAVRALERDKAIQFSAACGSGKTLMSQAAVQGHSRGGYRAIVFCPPHLTAKWEREIRGTVKNAHIHHINSFRDLLTVRKDAPPFGRGWWIVSNTVAKLGPGWRPAFTVHRYRKNLAFCPKCHYAQIAEIKKKGERIPKQVPIPLTDFFKKKLTCVNEGCHEPLWQWVSKPAKWPVATYIHKKLPKWFQYCIIDESHQGKSDTSAIGQAVGSLIAACDKTILLTGTLCGGYADDLRSNLLRMNPGPLVAEGLTWDNPTQFLEKYGRMEMRIIETFDHEGGSDNKQSRGRTTKTVKYRKPGVMPSLFGRHLIGSTIFLALEEMADNLPAIEESVIPVAMDRELQDAYDEVSIALVEAVREMLRRKDKRMLSAMLQTLLGYGDHPYGWKEVGYYDFNPETGANIWRTVVIPPNLDKNIVRPKERQLIDTCLAEKAAGRQVWVYCVMTDARDVNERLRKLLASSGLRVDVLRSSVETGDREAWIAEKAPKLDVCISHPQLVETGLDLFDKQGSYNFPTLFFYSPGFSTFTVRQASRRAWRIGQKELCKVFYSCYTGTAQEDCLGLMAKKQKASESIEGRFSAEGLLALCGDDGDISLALARRLVEQIGSGRSWQKVRR